MTGSKLRRPFHRRQTSWYTALALLLSAELVGPGCAVDSAPAPLRTTPQGRGAVVRFDLAHRPLPEIPLPNDIATWPDPSSRTGLRLNASLVAETGIEQTSRIKMDHLEGWSTYGWLTVAFDMPDKRPGQAALDLQNIVKRHQGDDYDFADDTVYLINLKTGVPVALDLGEGSFNYTVADKREYWANDPRRTEQSLLFETYDEAPGLPVTTPYRPSLDTDFDGVLDRPNLDDPTACPPPPTNLNASDAQQAPRDRCIADHIMNWYERQTDTLIINPVVPLDEMTEYAVVITDRLRDSRGRVVRSPFSGVYHPMQRRAAERVRDVLSSHKVANYYGDIAGTGLEHVAFTWSYTTQPVYDDMEKLRNGIYGTGPFAHLSDEFPPVVHIDKLAGMLSRKELKSKEGKDDSAQNPRCKGMMGNRSIVKFQRLVDSAGALLENAGVGSGAGTDEVLDLWKDYLDYFVFGTYPAPFYMEGGPQGTKPDASFRLNYKTGEGEIHTDHVPFVLSIPKATAKHKPPFPVVVYTHGSGTTKVESMAFAGSMARYGFATITIDEPGHGVEVSDTQELFFSAILKSYCLAPMADALMRSRARDLDHNGRIDSGGDLWTSYFFHTRDVVRQSALDNVALVRLLRSFDGKRVGDDYNEDGVRDLAGDFNADGVVDIGGPDNRYRSTGSSFGAIVSTVFAAVDPYVQVASPISAGGGLVDVGMRSNEGQVVNAVVLGLTGPLIVGRPISDYGRRPVSKCKDDQISVRWIVPHLKKSSEIEIGCVDTDDLPSTGGTVLITNEDTGVTRCVRSDKKGRFRVSLPTTRGDAVTISMYNKPDNVDSYATCRVVDPSSLSREISTWESGFIHEGSYDYPGNPVCKSDDGCVAFSGKIYGVGDPLVSPTDGFGLRRQSPELRRLAGLGQAILNPADPINYSQYYGLRPIRDPWGKVRPTHALYDTYTSGDRTVPVTSAIAIARAGGVVPFLRPSAASKYPEQANYVTPQALYDALGGKTPNRVLIDDHVIEGIARLARHPAAKDCDANESPLSDTSCHAACGGDLGTDNCRMSQRCRGSVCQRTISSNTCRNAVFDVDALDEGKATFHEQEAPVPLRLGRIAAPATSSNISEIWRPRLLGVPGATTDVGAWDASAPVSALVGVYVEPWGVHCWNLTDRCLNFDTTNYMTQAMGHYLDTDGKDLYYLSHPATHQCLEDATCPFNK